MAELVAEASVGDTGFDRAEDVLSSADEDGNGEEGGFGECDGDANVLKLEIDIASHESGRAEFADAKQTEEGEEVHAPITSASEGVAVAVAVSFEESEISECESSFLLRSCGVTVIIVQAADDSLE
jgi:hypothetical protein